MPRSADTKHKHVKEAMRLPAGKPFPYADILHEKHHVSPTRAKMSMTERAAQFAPFAALTGYDAAIAETARLTDGQAELDDCAKGELNQKFCLLQEHCRERPQIRVTYFVSDSRKEGGAYVSIQGAFKKIDSHTQLLFFTDGQAIPLKDILELDCSLFSE